MTQSASKVSLDVFQKFVNTKQDLFNAALRNGYYLPSYKSSMITESYLIEVIQAKVWCPLYKDIKLLPCISPPPVADLLDKLKSALRKINKEAGISDTHVPNKSWIINVLSTISQKDEIFEKGYIAPKKSQKTESTKTIEITQSFFTGLPQIKRTKKRKSLSIMREGKMQVKQKFLLKMKEAVERRIDDNEDLINQRVQKRQKLENQSQNDQSQKTPNKQLKRDDHVMTVP